MTGLTGNTRPSGKGAANDEPTSELGARGAALAAPPATPSPAPAAVDVEGLIDRLTVVLADWNSAEIPAADLPSFKVLCASLREAATALAKLAAERDEAQRLVNQLSDDITFLRKRRGDLVRERDAANDAREAHAKCTTALIAAAEARASALDVERDRLREALDPFAEAAASYDPDEGDGGNVAWSHDFTIASLRRARAALSAKEGT